MPHRGSVPSQSSRGGFRWKKRKGWEPILGKEKSRGFVLPVTKGWANEKQHMFIFTFFVHEKTTNYPHQKKPYQKFKGFGPWIYNLSLVFCLKHKFPGGAGLLKHRSETTYMVTYQLKKSAMLSTESAYTYFLAMFQRIWSKIVS